MASYQRLATSPTEADTHEEEELSRANPLSRSTLAEFNRPAPAWWKRALVLFSIVFLGWLAWNIGRFGNQKPKIIYATRYSEEHRYRPAASPVITEYLKDGRIRLRGATPGGVGIKPGDLPMTPQQKMYLKKRQKEEAEAKAKEALKERRRRRKEQLIAKKRKAYADRDP